MTKEVLALGLTVLVHVIGLGALVWALLLGDEERPDLWGWWPRDDDGPPPPEPPAPTRGGGLPLPDAEQAGARLREPGRLRDRRPPAPRRPSHRPEREPARR
jgi:hypothetical protein